MLTQEALQKLKLQVKTFVKLRFILYIIYIGDIRRPLYKLNSGRKN